MKHALEFEFIAGCPALCFVDTFGSRGGEGREKLKDPQSLCNWLEDAGLLTTNPCVATHLQLDHARTLREAIHRCCLRAMGGRSLETADVATINQFAAWPPLRPQIKDGSLIHIGVSPVKAAFSVLAADALNLLGSPLIHRIRQCPGCAMLFVDRSRPGRRRWCSSAKGCGNRAKVRNFRARRGPLLKGGGDV